jgi:hypothetical protein
MRNLLAMVVATVLLTGARANDLFESGRGGGEPIFEERPLTIELRMLGGAEVLLSDGRRLTNHEAVERYLRDQSRRLQQSMASGTHVIVIRGFNDAPVSEFIRLVRLCKKVCRDSARIKMIVEHKE